MFRKIAAAAAVTLSLVEGGASAAPVSFLAIGDTGYIPAYEQFDHGETPPRTLGAYMAAEADDWLESHPDLTGFTPTPWVFETAHGGFMNASGMYPVAWAAKEVCRREGCRFAAMLGDNIYPDGATLGADGIADARRFEDMLDKPYGDLGAGVPDFTIYAMMGNHDWHISREATMAQLAYLQAHPNFTMPGLFYRATPKGLEGEVELFVIDTEMLLAGHTVYRDKLDAEGREIRTGELDTWPDFVKPATPEERRMVAWLEEALASSTARWKIVMGHHALWSSGGSKYEKAHTLKGLLMPALCRYADLYISGDDHLTELYSDDCAAHGMADRPPLPLIVAGAGSKYRPQHPAFFRRQLADNPGLKNHFAQGSTWGFAHVTVDGEVLTTRLYSTPTDMSGRPVEELEMEFRRRSGGR